MAQTQTEKPVLIALTGGRSTPTILCALALKPRTVEFINSEDEPQREDEIRNALPSEMNQSCKGLSVSAHDAQQVIDACETLTKRHPSGSFVISISSGTKVMAIGAYKFADSKGISALYVDTGGRRILDLTTHSEPELPTMTVESYLACFGRRMHAKFDEDGLSVSRGKAIKAAEKIIEFGEAGLNVLERIRIDGKGKDEPRNRRIKNYIPSEEERRVWDFLISVGLLGNARNDDKVFIFTIKSHADYAFLEGGWLELYCWHQAKQQMDLHGAPLFDDVQFNFEIPSAAHGARKEVDVGLMYAGQMILCSCKAGKNKIWSNEHLDELSAVSSLMGGRFCSRIFITTKYPPTEEEKDAFRQYQRFLNQAQDREIVVIDGRKLADVGALLAREATHPTYWRV